MKWEPIETAPHRQRVLVCGGDDLRGRVIIAQSIPGACSPLPVNDVRHEWYSDTTRGTGKIWPSPTHWMPLPPPTECANG